MILHVDILTEDIDKMKKFYEEKLDMAVISDQIVQGDIVKFFSNKFHDTYRIVLLQDSKVGTMLELMEFIDNEHVSIKKEGIPRVTITFLTSSLKKKMHILKKRGLNPDSAIFNVDLSKVGTSRVVFYRDPDGNLVEFLEMVNTGRRKEYGLQK